MWRVVVEESLSVRIVDFAIASESFEGEMTNYKEKRFISLKATRKLRDAIISWK